MSAIYAASLIFLVVGEQNTDCCFDLIFSVNKMMLASPARPVLSMVTFSRCRYFSSLVKQHETIDRDGEILGLDLSLPAIASNPRFAARRLLVHSKQLQQLRHPVNRQNLSLREHQVKVANLMLAVGGRGNLRTNPLLSCDVSQSVLGKKNTADLSVSDGLQQSSANSPRGDVTPGQSNKVPPEKLQYAFNELEKHLPRFFVRVHPYALYDRDIIFEDHIRGIVVKGINSYALSLVIVRTKAQICYAKCQFHVLKMTMHPEDGTIRVRWQVEGVQGWRYTLTFWKYGVFRYFFGSKDPYISTKTDGFSIFYLNSQGLIYKHLCDKMMPDDSGQTNPVKDNKNAIPI